IEPLLKDDSIADILINTHKRVFIERRGVIEETAIRFRDEAHLLRIVNKIVSAIGRRVDESSPMADARLEDGSRVNIAVRPISIEPLLKDDSIADILINTHKRVFIERRGVIEETAIRFRDEAHLLRIVNKIVSAIGRRVDESSPMADARLEDGSRVNIAVRPI